MAYHLSEFSDRFNPEGSFKSWKTDDFIVGHLPEPVCWICEDDSIGPLLRCLEERLLSGIFG